MKKSQKFLLAFGLMIVFTMPLLAGCGSNQTSTTTTENTTTTTTAAATTTTTVDTTASASQVNDEATFVQKISSDNSDYMVIVNKDLTFTNDLIVKSGVKSDTPNRSIAPAQEDADHNITARYTITVPNLVFSGLNEKVEYGIITGDVYVQADGFSLKDATINGNLYFATDALKNAFVQDATTTISGTIGVKTYTPDVDAAASASQVNDEATFVQKISSDNTDYMVIVNKDLTFINDLIVESGVKSDAPNRSIAPAQEDADHNITARYTITVPNLVFSGQNEKVEYGIITGDVYVQDTGFTLKDATINGNLYFATDALKNAFVQDATTTISGTIGVKTYTN